MLRKSRVRSVRSVAAMTAFIISISIASTSSAQQPVPPLPGPQSTGTATVTGQVRKVGSLEPIAKAVVIIEGTAIQATTDGDGRFTLKGVPAGDHHIIIAAPGYTPLRAEVAVKDAATAPIDAVLAPEVHYTETVSVSPEARDQFASYQPTSVLAGQDLNRELEMTIGGTLSAQPGVAERSFGPGPSRPVIRGLDGDRVLILEDGQRVGDLSSQSADHGVPVNPAMASRIEVVRGPATLLYGANAIGGLVNVINETIPTRPIDGAHGAVVTDFGTAAEELVGGVDLSAGNGRWAVRAGGSGQRNGDVTTPAGDVENSQSRAGFGNVGVSWTGAKGYVGGSYGYDDTRYGIPVVEEGQVELTPRRHMFAVKGERTQLAGPISALRADFASRRYQHDEVVGGEVGTHFENDTDEINVLAKHRQAGRLTGSIGAWVLRRNFLAEGEEALAPPIKERGVAAFVYEELTWPHFTVQFGGRLNHASYDPEQDLPARDFTDTSGSVGLLFRPAAAENKLTFAVNLARAARNPALEELYFFGPHPGNFAFEIGNPDLESERALGVDLSVRWRTGRATGEVTYFRNSIDDYIFRNPISEEEFDERFGHGEEEEGEGEHGEFPFIEFVAANSLLQGVEAHTDVELGRGFGMELGFDYVRGELRDTGDPLPRIPPLRFRCGVNYQRNAFQAGGEVVLAAKQERVFGEETPTDGYNLLKLFASYSFGTTGAASTITARLDNATNELYRNHLSLIKDFVPEIGRNFKVVYSLRF
jgi:iron complex outermembrane recepter protein